MTNLNTIRESIATLPKGPPLVIAITGGTTGIGSYIAAAFARAFSEHGHKLRIYIIGRSTSRAETVLEHGRATSPGSDWRFIQAEDLSLMSDVERISKEIIRQEENEPFAGGVPRLDALYMSQALSPLQPSKPTSESLDTQLSLLYYSRIHFILTLLPLLLSTPKPSHVISVFAGGFEDRISSTTLPIGTPLPENYNPTSVRTHVAFMKTFLFESLAEKYAGKISFVHIYPGLVDGPTFYSDVNPLWFRILWRVMKPLIGWYMNSPEDCGSVMVSLATGRYPAKGVAMPGDESGVIGGVAYSTQRELGGGAYGVGQRGDEMKDVSYEKLRKEDTTQKVWEHTMGVLEGINRKSAIS
ncbi:hypothetical protein BKA63DRAFT_70011 [Paraphoma chrysanthemicola]|nr:hypothetical protein BKA63DRAFT_70011 [Paraphoma chrysanthemicola]